MNISNVANQRRQIAEAFAGGIFEVVFPYLCSEAEWNVIGEFNLKGKHAIVQKCREVSSYFTSIQTDFQTLNIIEGEMHVVINGTAAFFRDGKQVAYVSSCDIYEFDANANLKAVTSYCIKDAGKGS